MKSVIAMALFSVFYVLTGFSQKDGQIVIIKNKYYHCDTLSTKKEIKSVLKHDPASAAMYKRSRTNATIGSVLIVGGTLSLLTGVVVRLADRTNEASSIQSGKVSSSNSSAGIAPVLIGAGLILAAIPFSVSGNKQLKKSIKLYNSKGVTSSCFQPELDLGIAPDGVSVKFRF